MLLVKVHTVYWQYYSSVSTLPLAPMALGTWQYGNRQTRDICQLIAYTVCTQKKDVSHAPSCLYFYFSLGGGGGGGGEGGGVPIDIGIYMPLHSPFWVRPYLYPDEIKNI